MFLAANLFFIIQWFAGIYVKGCIRKLFLGTAIMQVVRNTVGGAKFTFPMMASFLLGMALRMSPTNKRDRLNLDYTHSGQYGYQLVLTRDNKNGIERKLGRAIFGTGNFYDCTKTA